MKILIVSDTHRENYNFMKVLDKESPIDLLVHCGDIEGSEYIFSQVVKCPMHLITGNNDFFSDLPAEKEFKIGNLNVFLTHGHAYRVSAGLELLRQEGRARGADIVMFGHIHRPVAECVGGMWLINPGSVSYPRQDGRRPSYIVMNLEDDGEPKFEVKYL